MNLEHRIQHVGDLRWEKGVWVSVGWEQGQIIVQVLDFVLGSEFMGSYYII